MGEAIAYALNREGGLKEYLKDGRLCMENNPAERALRAIAVGRKNWTFFQNEADARTATIMFSLVMTAKCPTSITLPRRIASLKNVTGLPHGNVTGVPRVFEAYASRGEGPQARAKLWCGLDPTHLRWVTPAGVRA